MSNIQWVSSTYFVRVLKGINIIALQKCSIKNTSCAKFMLCCKLSPFLLEKLIALPLHEKPITLLRRLSRGGKSPSLGGFWTHDLLIASCVRVLYPYIELPPLPLIKNDLDLRVLPVQNELAFSCLATFHVKKISALKTISLRSSSGF